MDAVDLARKGTARRQAAVELAHPEQLRRYGLLQAWILVPFAILCPLP